jgi:aminoglycoside phosphotransferase (APT) family kinase protein
VATALPSSDEVECIAQEVLGSPHVRILEAQHGYGNQTWRVVDAAGRPHVLKLGDPASAPKWRSAHRALELAAREGVPVPELVYDGHHGRRLVRVFTWVDGAIAKDRELDEAQEERFVASLGRAVAALHRVRLDGFSSRLDGSAPVFARWADYLAHRFQEVRARCEATGAIAPAVVDRAASVLDALAGSFDAVAEPVLCHRDLHPGNLVLGPDGTIHGIIDWDMAEPWDRAGDWFKLEYEVLRTRPGRTDDLLAAYLDGAPVPPRWSERRRAVHLVETLNILPNAVTQGWNDHYVDRARHHLEHLLAQG